MYGRYTKDLGEYAKDEARRLKQLERQRKKDDRARDKVNELTIKLTVRYGTLNIKQQWWEFSGITRKPPQRENISSCLLVLATFICANG
jgi:hypothetical protein